MSDCGAYTLGEITEKYCIRLFNDKRRNYLSFFNMAKDVWRKIFLRTIWAYQSVWLDVLKGDPYPYVELPKNMKFFIDLYYIDKTGRNVPCRKNNNYNVIPKPKKRSCGCTTSCNCGDGCTSVNTFTFTSKEVVINATTYLHKTWLQKCPNGDIVQWDEIPTLSDAGVEIFSRQTRLCTLDLHPCGCVVESDLNTKKLNEFCGCHILHRPATDVHTQQPCDGAPEIRMSPCGKKLYIINNTQTQYLLDFQPKEASAFTLVPSEALDVMLTGIDHESKRFNPSVPFREKQEAKRQHDLAIDDLSEFYNPIPSIEDLNRIRDEGKKW